MEVGAGEGTGAREPQLSMNIFREGGVLWGQIRAQGTLRTALGGWYAVAARVRAEGFLREVQDRRILRKVLGAWINSCARGLARVRRLQHLRHRALTVWAREWSAALARAADRFRARAVLARWLDAWFLETRVVHILRRGHQ